MELDQRTMDLSQTRIRPAEIGKGGSGTSGTVPVVALHGQTGHCDASMGRDPYKFPDFIHSQKRHPRTNLRDDTMQWDFWSHSPESVHQVTILFSDRGLPRSYRHMNGYGSHAYSFVNEAGKRFWVKFHFKT